MNDLYIKTMRRLSQIPDNSVKITSEQGENICLFVSKLIEDLRKAGEQEKADTVYAEANKKFVVKNRKSERNDRKS